MQGRLGNGRWGLKQVEFTVLGCRWTKRQKVTSQPNTETTVGCQRIWLPMAKTVKMAPKIRVLLQNILISDSFKQGVPIKVPKEAKVHLISSKHYNYHRKILEDTGLDDVVRVSMAKQQLLKKEWQ